MRALLGMQTCNPFFSKEPEEQPKHQTPVMYNFQETEFNPLDKLEGTTKGKKKKLGHVQLLITIATNLILLNKVGYMNHIR